MASKRRGPISRPTSTSFPGSTGGTLSSSWTDHAACSDKDPEMFFPDSGDRKAVEQAKAVCRTCPVVNECLTHALMYERNFGVWGGTTPEERRHLRRQLPGERTHCHRGHEYAVVGRDTQGACRQCRRESSAKWARRNSTG